MTSAEHLAAVSAYLPEGESKKNANSYAQVQSLKRDDPPSTSEPWRPRHVTSGIGFEHFNDVNHVPFSGQEGYGDNIKPFAYWPRSDKPPPPPATPPPRDLDERPSPPVPAVD